MDVGLNEAQELLKRNAREALAGLCPSSLVRSAEIDASASADLWRSLAELGWLGLPFPESLGGAGADLLTLMVLIEELGYAAAPTPFLPTVVQAGLAIADSEHAHSLIPRIVNGEIIATLAISEPGPRFVREGFQTTASLSGESIRLTGTKAYVAAAGLASHFVVVASSGDDVALVLVRSDDDGVTVTPQHSMAGEPIGTLWLDCRLPVDRMLAGGRESIDVALARSTLAEAAFQVGAADRASELAIEYAKNRVQFGRPIGTFQAIAHKCADMVVELDGARMTVYRAAWLMDEGLPFGGAVAMAKAWAGEAGKRIISNSHQIHGAIGFTSEYDLNLFNRRIKAHEFAFGRPEEHLAVIARSAGVAIDG